MTRTLLAAVNRRAPEHLRFGTVPHEEIAAFEARLGRRLPPVLVEVLEALGNGIYYGKEELLGPRRLMVHDIELLPDMLSVKALAKGLPDAWLPFHRRDGLVHAVDLSPEGFGEVHAWPGGAACGHIDVFLTGCLASR
jgi:SMI1/KNR4 family protein SUKH-1